MKEVSQNNCNFIFKYQKIRLTSLLKAVIISIVAD